MAKLVWDQIGQKVYETGVENVALYVMGDDDHYGTGVAWNGATEITEKPSGAEKTTIYADNIKYLNLLSAEDFGISISAYTYPDEFEACDGSAVLAKGAVIGQQSRKIFGLVYKTKLGNDTQGTDYGYKLHVVYGAQVSPSERGYQTINDSPEAITFSWEASTTPVPVTGHKPTALVTINSTDCDPDKLAALEAKLYGGENQEPTLLLPDQIAAELGQA